MTEKVELSRASAFAGRNVFVAGGSSGINLGIGQCFAEQGARLERSCVLPDDQLKPAARPIIEAMLTASPLGPRLTKECLRMSIDAPSLEAVIAVEDRNQVLCSSTPDFPEGVTEFFEQRRPACLGIVETAT